MSQTSPIHPGEMAFFASIIESSEDAIISKDTHGIITSWNAGAERLFGYSRDEAIGKSITLIIPEENLHEERTILDRILRGERIEHYETVRRARDGRLLDISLSISPIHDEKGHIIGASKVARDISERKRSEAELRLMDQRKNEFLATLAHELRNPLAPLRNAVEVIRLSNGNVSGIESARAIMERQLVQMTRLIDDLLDLSRISSGKIDLRREVVDIAAIVHSAVETSQPSIDAAGHRLMIKLPSSPVWVFADSIRIAQVLANLLNNATRYTPRGGVIRLEVRPTPQLVCISVSDNGSGIPAEMLPHVFEMFAQVDRSLERSHGGLGIGLSIARQLIGMHDGTVEAFSEGAGQGSEFVVTLPRHEKAAPDEKAGHPSSEAAAPAAPRRILVADDNVDSASSLAMMLKILGHDVRVAYDGLAATDVAAEYLPDLVLLDIGMPKLNGYDVCRRLREMPATRSAQIIALTGWGQEEARESSRAAGFDRHLVKPIDLDDLKGILAPGG